MVADIAILGAGPSGLLLARLLEINNFNYIVFERDSSPSSIGQSGTLDIHEKTGQRAIKEAGLIQEFEATARYDAQRFEIVDKNENSVCMFDGTHSKGRPEIDRKDLRALLLKAVPPHRIQWGHRVKKIQRQRSGRMSVHFEDGSEQSDFKLVVGADGTWSRARELVTSAKPQYSGLCFLQASFEPGHELYDYLASKAGKGTYGAMSDGKQILAQNLGDGSYNVYVALRTPEDWSHPDDAQLRDDLLKNDFADWFPGIRNVLANCESFHAWRLWAMDPGELSWETVPGVALIGDAAHVSTPFVGEGVNQALTDSMELCREIIRCGVDRLDEAVAAYEKIMLPRAIDFIQRSDHSGKLMFAPDSPKGFIEMLESHKNAQENDR